MKKTGFTLAEVLITLAIIGVVATMTLPALMANTNEQQAKTGLKKVINTLSVAAESNMGPSGTGFDFSSLGTNSTANDTEDTMSLYGLLLRNTKIDAKAMNNNDGTTGNNFLVIFRDGSSLEFPTSRGENYATNRNVKAVIDINGPKQPNVMSNCRGTVTTSGVKFGSSTVNDNAGSTADTACDTKTDRVIRDKFSVLLLDDHVEPNGPAARWTYGN